jgi:hypothetical protein
VTHDGVWLVEDDPSRRSYPDRQIGFFGTGRSVLETPERCRKTAYLPDCWPAERHVAADRVSYLAAVDVAIRDRLLAGGYTVDLIDDNAATAGDAVGVSFVYLSSSINSTVVGDKFAAVAAPVWVAKPWSLDDMGMTGASAGTDFGTTRSDIVAIVDDAHPLAGGFTGDVVVSSAPKSLSWGLPAGAGTVVATSNGYATNFVYQGGDLLADGSTAAGCRMHVSAFQTAGWAGARTAGRCLMQRRRMRRVDVSEGPMGYL